MSQPNPNDPNPARSSATLSAFTGQVQRRLGLETQSEAEILTRVAEDLRAAGLTVDLSKQPWSLAPRISAVAPGRQRAA